MNNCFKPTNMFFDHEARKKFYEEEIKSGDIFEHNEELFQKISACPENLQRLNSAVFPKNAITIIGYAKSGSHLMMSILDAMGVTRLESLLPEKASWVPIEFNANAEHLDEQTRTCAEFDGLIQTPHGHMTPSNFPLGHAGKIIFIERDTPAVVVSAFHFFQKLPFIQPYLKKHGINDDLQKFARFVMEGKFVYGQPDEYNQKWKNFAKEHPELQIEFFKFEEILADKPKEIKRLIKFLEIENADVAKIVEESDIKKAREHRRKEAEKTGAAFVEGLVFRKGNAAGWKEELTSETLEFYESLKK